VRAQQRHDERVCEKLWRPPAPLLPARSEFPCDNRYCSDSSVCTAHAAPPASQQSGREGGRAALAAVAHSERGSTASFSCAGRRRKPWRYSASAGATKHCAASTRFLRMARNSAGASKPGLAAASARVRRRSGDASITRAPCTAARVIAAARSARSHVSTHGAQAAGSRTSTHGAAHLHSGVVVRRHLVALRMPPRQRSHAVQATVRAPKQPHTQRCDCARCAWHVGAAVQPRRLLHATVALLPSPVQLSHLSKAHARRARSCSSGEEEEKTSTTHRHCKMLGMPCWHSRTYVVVTDAYCTAGCGTRPGHRRCRAADAAAWTADAAAWTTGAVQRKKGVLSCTWA
jgi:hypothetical protein